VMAHTKRDTVALQVEGWAWGSQPHPVKSLNCWKAFNDCSRMETPSKIKDLQGGTRNVLSPYRSGHLRI
jgi:hypothetical protein